MDNSPTPLPLPPPAPAWELLEVGMYGSFFFVPLQCPAQRLSFSSCKMLSIQS